MQLENPMEVTTTDFKESGNVIVFQATDTNSSWVTNLDTHELEETQRAKVDEEIKEQEVVDEINREGMNWELPS